MIHEIVLDTETTGFKPEEGHRIIEIGCLELNNHVPTGRSLQLYLNPERDVPAEATAVHGITNEFLSDKPVFSQVYDQFLDFIGQAKLVIHNAEFDMRFINHELSLVGHPPIPFTRAIDTVMLARKKFPGSPANLDALCRRFGIDNSERTYHGALLDSELLAEVYLELLGGRQHGLGFSAEKQQQAQQESAAVKRTYRAPRTFQVTEEELAAHQSMVVKLQDALWLKKENRRKKSG
jgi:DNA polymerase-3 subunit epsilon